MNECQVRTLYREYREAKRRLGMPYAGRGIAWARSARLYHAKNRICQRNAMLIERGLLFPEYGDKACVCPSD